MLVAEGFPRSEAIKRSVRAIHLTAGCDDPVAALEIADRQSEPIVAIPVGVSFMGQTSLDPHPAVVGLSLELDRHARRASVLPLFRLEVASHD